MVSLNIKELQELTSILSDSCKILLPEDSRLIIEINKDGTSPTNKEEYKKGYDIEFLEVDGFMIATISIKIEKQSMLIEEVEAIKRNRKFREDSSIREKEIGSETLLNGWVRSNHIH